MMNRLIVICFITIFFIVAGPGVVSAQQWLATFNFTCISGGSCNSGGDKLNLKITTLGENSSYDIRFTFLNSWQNGKVIDSVITGIEFLDDQSGLSILDHSKIYISSGTEEVDFSPADNNSATLFNANSPTSETGVHPGDSISIKYAFADVDDDISDLVSAIGDSSLSIQLNVQMIGSRGDTSSALFTLNSGEGPVPIPEPATMLLLGTGLVGIAAATRKRFNIT